MELFVIGVVVGLVIASVWSRSRNNDGVDGEFDMVYRTLKDLLRELKVIHDEVCNPCKAPYDVQQDVIRSVHTQTQLMAQLSYLSTRFIKSREIRAKWEKLGERGNQLDEYLDAQLSEPSSVEPRREGIEDHDSPETIRWLS